MYVWQMPIPAFNPQNERHVQLAHLAASAEKLAASVILDAGKRFETQRRIIREAVAVSDTGRAIEREVAALLAP